MFLNLLTSFKFATDWKITHWQEYLKEQYEKQKIVQENTLDVNDGSCETIVLTKNEIIALLPKEEDQDLLQFPSY